MNTDKYLPQLQKMGRKIKHARVIADFTQEELADKIGGITRSSIGQIERGDTNTDIKMLLKIADAVGCHVGSFFTERG